MSVHNQSFILKNFVFPKITHDVYPRVLTKANYRAIYFLFTCQNFLKILWLSTTLLIFNCVSSQSSFILNNSTVKQLTFLLKQNEDSREVSIRRNRLKTVWRSGYWVQSFLTSVLFKLSVNPLSCLLCIIYACSW